MTRTEPDNVLWEMTRHSVEAEGDPIDDDLLRAYRAGELADEEAARVERSLGKSAAARRRLAELAGLDTSYAPPSVRRRLLGDESPNGSARPSTSWWKGAAAAVLVVGLAGVFAVYQQRQQRAPTQSAAFDSVEFDVAIRGSAVVRSAPSASAAASPDTVLEIRVEAREAVTAPFEVGVYRRRGDELRRVERDLEHQSFQGAATVRGLARDLAGAAEPGDYPIYLAVAAAGELPKTVHVVPDTDPASSLEAEGRQIYSRELTLLGAQDEEAEEDG